MNKNGQNLFVGEYVKDIRDVGIASLVSKTNVALYSAPGWGKSAILHSLGKTVAGDSHFKMFQFSPSFSPTKIDGAVDPQKWAEESIYYENQTGTPYDPEIKVALFDELYRGSDPSFDSAIHASDPLKQNHCVIWATSNFLASGDRVNALVDRFPWGVWIKPQAMDMRAIVTAQMLSGGEPQIPGDLPNWERIEEVRTAKPGMKAVDTVVNYLEGLEEEAVAEGFQVHPRRASQWRSILYFYNVFHTGTADFDSLDPQATRIMQFAWPSTTMDEFERWRKTARAIVDRIGAVIDQILIDAVDHFVKVAEMPDQGTRTAASAELGPVMAGAQETLTQLGSNDPRIKESIVTLSEWFRMAVRDEKPTLGSTL
jgi:hypothetical protein